MCLYFMYGTKVCYAVSPLFSIPTSTVSEASSALELAGKTPEHGQHIMSFALPQMEYKSFTRSKYVIMA